MATPLWAAMIKSACILKQGRPMGCFFTQVSNALLALISLWSVNRVNCPWDIAWVRLGDPCCLLIQLILNSQSVPRAVAKSFSTPSPLGHAFISLPLSPVSKVLLLCQGLNIWRTTISNISRLDCDYLLSMSFHQFGECYISTNLIMWPSRCEPHSLSPLIIHCLISCKSKCPIFMYARIKWVSISIKLGGCFPWLCGDKSVTF